MMNRWVRTVLVFFHSDPKVLPCCCVNSRFPAGVLAVIAVGGAAGTLLRAWLAQVMPPGANGFPWDTFTVNVVGSAVIGFVVVTALARLAPSRLLRPLLATGFCGGLTTFSTFVVEADLLIKNGHGGLAALYVVTSLAAGLGAAWAGSVLARVAFSREMT
jgi:CrcB protein